jgi:hypothetical protein
MQTLWPSHLALAQALPHCCVQLTCSSEQFCDSVAVHRHYVSMLKCCVTQYRQQRDRAYCAGKHRLRATKSACRTTIAVAAVTTLFYNKSSNRKVCNCTHLFTEASTLSLPVVLLLLLLLILSAVVAALLLVLLLS